MPSGGVLAINLNTNTDVWKNYSSIALLVEYHPRDPINFPSFIIHHRNATHFRFQPHRPVPVTRNSCTPEKHYGYERLYRGFRRRNFLCNLSAGKFIISAAVAGDITLNAVVIVTLTGVGLVLKAVADLKKIRQEGGTGELRSYRIPKDPR